MLKRAGLDYWQHVDVHEYDSIEDLFRRYPEGQFFFVEDYGSKLYDEHDFSDCEADIFLVFGRETSGIPQELLLEHEEGLVRLPMSGKVRSLNLANTVAIVLYEALRQQQFPNLF